jgi:hypothetical protein
MSWTSNKILLHPSPNHAPKDIFQAVCDELGDYFKNKGFRYAKSRPKLSYKDKQIKLEINFWSSRSNMAGEYVNLEILPYFYAVELAKTKHKGLLFGHAALFNEKYSDDPHKIKIVQIYGENLERIEAKSKESLIKYNNNCNIYGINENRFNKIIEFIEEKILPWITLLQTKEGVESFLRAATNQRIFNLALDHNKVNSCFKDYMNLKFQEITNYE